MPLACDYQYSKGYGTGVAEAVGNWGFSNGISSKGNELERIQCVLNEMDCLRSSTQKKPVIICCNERPLCVKPSPKECQPVWMNPMKRPLMTYSSVNEVLVVSNLKDSAPDLAFPIPGRYYYQQRSDKWYKKGPECCSQPSCLAPVCSRLY